MQECHRQANPLSLTHRDPLDALVGQRLQRETLYRLFDGDFAIGSWHEGNPRPVLQVIADGEAGVKARLAGGQEPKTPLIFPPVGGDVKTVHLDRAPIGRDQTRCDP